MQFWQFWIALIAALVMAGGLYGIYTLIIKQNAVIGTKTIQFIAILFVLPVLVILGVTGILRAESIGPIIGVIVGFVFSNFAKE